MRKSVFLAAICALLCAFFLTSCSDKTETEPKGSPEQSPNTSDSAENPSGEPSAEPSDSTFAGDEQEDSGDSLAKVVSITGNAYEIEYYSGSPIGDYTAIDAADFAPTGDKETLTFDEETSVYIVKNGAWSASTVDEIKTDDYLVVTIKPETGNLLWVTIIR